MSQTAVIGRAAESFVIEGGRSLHGRIQSAGNKNGALPILAACLLTSEPVQLANVPRIRDVETMIELLADLGADVVQELEHRLDVRDPRHVVQRHRLRREEARGEDRQGAVLVAGCLDPPVQGAPTLDHERLGGAPD